MAKGTGCPSLVLANSKSVAVGVGEGLKKVKERQGREIMRGQDSNKDMGDRERRRRRRKRRKGWERRNNSSLVSRWIQMCTGVFPITLVVLRVPFPGIHQH